MEKYMQSLKIQNIGLLIGTLCLITVQILALCGVFASPASDAHWADFWSGIIAGASFAITVLFIVGFIVNLRALRDPAKLKKLYAKEHDERTVQIVYHAQSNAYRLSILGLLVAAIVAGYFSTTVCITCLIVVFIQSVLGGIFKLYWHHRL